jgi:hypothetical protein
LKLLGRSVHRCGLNISRWDEDAGLAISDDSLGRLRILLKPDRLHRPGGMSGLPKQLKNRQSCCRNATPAEYMFPNVKNAQKGGTCSSFLLHRSERAFQVGIS